MRGARPILARASDSALSRMRWLLGVTALSIGCRSGLCGVVDGVRRAVRLYVVQELPHFLRGIRFLAEQPRNARRAAA
jgi:hypothetical protein